MVATVSSRNEREDDEENLERRELDSTQLHQYSQLNTEEEEPPRKSRSCYKQSKKKWIIGFSICSIIILILVLLIIFVGCRAIAQSAMNGSIVTVQEMTLGSFSNDNTMLNVQVVGSIANGSPFNTKLRSFDVWMEYNGQEFGKLPFPEMIVSTAKASIFNIEGLLVILDIESFNNFVGATISDKEITINMKGKVSAHAMGLTFNELNMKKTVTLNGLQGFNSPSPVVTKQNVVETTDDGISLAFSVKMHNPSTFVLRDTGKLTVRMYYDSTLIGYATTNNQTLSIPKGDFYCDLTAQLVRTDSNDKILENLLSTFTTGEETEILMHGENTTVSMLSVGVASLQTVTKLNGLATLLLSEFPPFQSLENSPSNISPFQNNISPLSIANFLLARPIQSLPWILTTVFSPLPATVSQGLTTLIKNGVPVVAVYPLAYNGLNTSVDIHSLNLSIYFHKDTSTRYPLANEMPQDFLLATASNISITTPLLTIKPMEFLLFQQDLIVSMESIVELSRMYNWMYNAYNLNNSTGLPNDMNIDICQKNQLNAASCSGILACSMIINGTLDVSIGGTYRTIMRINQVTPVQISLYDTSFINITTMKYQNSSL